MSFILDALKKSEAERQRQAGPALLELRITQPRRRYPLWALLVGGLLALNVVVLLVIVLRRPTAAPAATLASTAATTAPTAAAVTAAPALTPAVGAPASAPRAVAPLLDSAPAARLTNTPAAIAAPTGATGASDQSAATASGNPADYEPAVRAQSANPADYASLPSLSELSGNLPALQLNLLDYSDRPSDRYALINMHRVHEGDVLPDGTHVLAIMRTGVAMQYNGQQFMLRPGGTVQSGQ